MRALVAEREHWRFQGNHRDAKVQRKSAAILYTNTVRSAALSIRIVLFIEPVLQTSLTSCEDICCYTFPGKIHTTLRLVCPDRMPRHHLHVANLMLSAEEPLQTTLLCVTASSSACTCVCVHNSRPYFICTETIHRFILHRFLISLRQQCTSSGEQYTTGLVPPVFLCIHSALTRPSGNQW